MLALNHKLTWQDALSDLVTDPEELLAILELDASLLVSARAAARVFPLRVPRGFLDRIQKDNLDDPLLKQILPLGAELKEVNGYVTDPLQERSVNPIPGLLHKYHGRVLITLTSACAVHCRYCFRRHFPYAENNPGTAGWGKIVAYLADNTSITEVILSGGDPLSVHDKLLKRFTDQLSQLPHIKRLRIHTRLPIVLPERITPDFIHWLQELPLDTVMVVHCNHANEINAAVKHVLQAARATGVTLLNQAVLLKGVNDDVETLVQLSETLFSAGVLPYYLHILDKVQGAAHFDVDVNTARTMHAELASRLPGYLVPKLACEEPGAPSKTVLSTELYTG